MRGFEVESGAGNESHTYVEGARYQAISTEEDANGQQSSPRIVEDPEPAETTPLVPREHLRPPTPPPSEGQGAIGWWILQLLLRAMNQTLTDGNSPALTYGAVSLLALLVILPMSPFSINAHRWLTFLVLAIFVLSTVYTWVAFPFSQKAPLKVYFAQIVNLTISGTGVERATTELTGPKQFLARYILPELPSAFGKSVACYDDQVKVGLQTCAWQVEAEMAPSPGGNARISVQGLNTRFCTLEFTNRRISKFSVAGDGDQGLQKGYEIPEQGLSQIQLWSRHFGKRFEVVIEWKDGDAVETDDELQGRVSCGWDEYERATIGGGRSGGQIPSLEEVIQFLPEWAVVSKSTSALFSAGRVFSLLSRIIEGVWSVAVISIRVIDTTGQIRSRTDTYAVGSSSKFMLQLPTCLSEFDLKAESSCTL
ncbi:hypothetical protein J3R82DRAFT_3135 [Butyriboletus roseoflavus]|nr:hypothetical protein J3R82DRAFT_3135 [Butyriboletus roseoflavus]